jgi:hypothetical protein
MHLPVRSASVRITTPGQMTRVRTANSFSKRLVRAGVTAICANVTVIALALSLAGAVPVQAEDLEAALAKVQANPAPGPNGEKPVLASEMGSVGRAHRGSIICASIGRQAEQLRRHNVRPWGQHRD